jgi:hypothetical protein
MTEPTVDLTVPALGTLRERRSEKWALYEPDVLSLTIAEMDFAIAAPIRDALVATIGRSDLGYAVPAPRALSAALVAFAQRRLSWSIDPEQVVVVPDVMLGPCCSTPVGGARRGGGRSQRWPVVAAVAGGLGQLGRRLLGCACQCGQHVAERRVDFDVGQWVASSLAAVDDRDRDLCLPSPVHEPQPRHHR